jgi:hypothetical protein
MQITITVQTQKKRICNLVIGHFPVLTATITITVQTARAFCNPQPHPLKHAKRKLRLFHELQNAGGRCSKND